MDSIASPSEGSTAQPPAPAAYPFLDPPESAGDLGRLGPFRVRRLLGAGGTGLVFRGKDPHLNLRVALKVLRPELAVRPQERRRFLRKARALSALRHDHVVTVYHVGPDGPAPYLAMEYLVGQPLDRWLAENTPSVGQVLRLGRETARALSAAHAHGLIHRAIKPANLWLEAPRGRVKVLDFGLSRSRKAIPGTATYLAPEQARDGVIDGRADLYSLGCVLYRMATGRVPSQDGDTPANPRDLNPELPPRLADLMLRLLAKTPENRPAGAAEVSRALVSIEADYRRGRPRPTSTPRRGASRPADRPSPESRPPL